MISKIIQFTTLFAAASIFAAETDNNNFGELIFHDDFERTESQELKDEPGNGWTTSSEKTAAGQKQVDLRDGAMHMHTAEGANHAASTRHEFSFEDGTIGMRFKLDNDGDKLQLNFADMTLKSVHAGHLFDAIVELDKVRFEDKKTGFMNLEIRKASRAGTLSAEKKSELLKTKRKNVANKISKGEWHDLLVHVEGQKLTIAIDGKSIGDFESEGIAHPTKGLLRFLVPGHASIDDIKIWRKK